MKPTCSEILRGVVANLEQLIVPQLEGPHAQSAGANALMLLEHMIVRLDAEGESLAADNAEKRSVLGALSDVPAPLQGAADDVAKQLTNVPEHGSYVSIAALTDENERLRAVMDEWLRAIHGADDVPEADRLALRQPVRSQLRNQVDREARLVAPVVLDRIFQNKDG